MRPIKDKIDSDQEKFRFDEPERDLLVGKNRDALVGGVRKGGVILKPGSF